MAYFDDPENLAAWQEELADLRAERERRASGQGHAQAQTEAPAPVREERRDILAEAVAQAREIKAARTIREPITFEQLEAEAGITAAPTAGAPAVSRQKSQELSRR